MKKFNAKMQEKESINSKTNVKKIKEKIKEEHEREIRDEEMIRTEKVAFQKNLQENQNRRKEEEIKMKKLELEREKLRKKIFQGVINFLLISIFSIPEKTKFNQIDRK